MFHATFGCYAQGVGKTTAIAGRPKELEFCRAVVERFLVTGRRLRHRLAKVKPLDQRVRAAVAAWIPT